MKALWVIGSGGHAKVVIETARATGKYEVAGCLDDDLGRLSKQILGVPILGPASERSVRELGVEHAVIAIGFNAVRQAIAARLANFVSWETLVHPATVVSESVRLGAGSVVFAGAVVQPDSVIGEHVILNTGCTVDHDAQIGDFAHIGPGAHLAGNVHVCEGGFLGVGVGVIPGMRIGAWSIVGAGAMVCSEIPDSAVAVGVPAKVIEQREPGWRAQS